MHVLKGLALLYNVYIIGHLLQGSSSSSLQVHCLERMHRLQRQWQLQGRPLSCLHLSLVVAEGALTRFETIATSEAGQTSSYGVQEAFRAVSLSAIALIM